jgi:hypothetical protein
LRVIQHLIQSHQFRVDLDLKRRALQEPFVTRIRYNKHWSLLRLVWNGQNPILPQLAFCSMSARLPAFFQVPVGLSRQKLGSPLVTLKDTSGRKTIGSTVSLSNRYDFTGFSRRRLEEANGYPMPIAFPKTVLFGASMGGFQNMVPHQAIGVENRRSDRGIQPVNCLHALPHQCIRI